MKLENQVCTLDQAKRLAEFEIWKDTDTLFVYVPPFPVFNDSLRLCLFSEFESRLKNSILSDDAKALVGYCPAYTVAELGVMLPENCDSRKDGSWWVCDEGLTGDCVTFHGDTEAEARAAMLIYLLENNLTTADEVNKSLTA